MVQCVIQGHEEIDTTKVVPENSKVIVSGVLTISSILTACHPISSRHYLFPLFPTEILVRSVCSCRIWMARPDKPLRK